MPSAGIMASSVYIPSTGVCTDVLSESFNNFSDPGWANSGGTIVTGRTGTSAQMGSFQQAIYTIPSLKRNSTITIGCAVKVSAGSNFLFGCWSPAGGTFHCRLFTNLATGTLFVANASGSNVGESVGGLITVGNWYYVEVKFVMDDTAGKAIVVLNGNKVIDVSGIDTRAGTATIFEAVQIGPPNSSGGGQVQYDDLYISTGSICNFKGDQACTSLFTDAFETLDPAWSGGFVSAGRVGNAMTLSGSSNSQRDWTPFSWYATVGFAFKVSHSDTVQRNIFSFRDSSGNDYATLYHKSGVLTFSGGTGAPVFGSAPGNLVVPNVWCYIEVQFFCDDTNGYFEVRFNEVSVMSGKNMDTQAITSPPTGAGLSRIFLRGAGSGTSSQWDDMYVTSGPGCEFQGDPSNCNTLIEDPFNNLYGWPEQLNTPAIVAGGRTGTCVQFQSGPTDPLTFDSIFYTFPAVYESGVATIGFAWKAEQMLQRVICQFMAEGIVHVELASNASGGFDIRRGTPAGNIIASTANGVWSIDTWYYLEVQVQLKNFGFAKMNVNGVQLINVSGVDTRNGGTKRKFDRIALGTTHGQVQYIDDLYLSTGPGCPLRGSFTPFVLYEPFNNFSAWTVTGTPALSIISGGRTGNAGFVPGNFVASMQFNVPAASESDTFVAGFAFKVGGMGSASGIFEWWNDSASYQGALQWNSAGSLLLIARTSSIVFTSAAGLIVANTWNYVEIKLKLHDSIGYWTIVWNGTVISSVAAQDTKGASTKTTIDKFRIWTDSFYDRTFDDMYISMGPSATFKGPIHIS